MEDEYTPKLGTFVVKRQSEIDLCRSTYIYNDENMWWYSRSMGPFELGMIIGYRRGHRKYHYILCILTSTGVGWVDDENVDEIS
jgi:hypothetical protein